MIFDGLAYLRASEIRVQRANQIRVGLREAQNRTNGLPDTPSPASAFLLMSTTSKYG